MGANGSGKSTLMNGLFELAQNPKSKKIKLITDPIRVFHHNSEKQGRNKGYIDESLPVPFQLNRHFQSHGESMWPFLSQIKDLGKGDLLLVDEPETSIDFIHIRLLLNMMIGLHLKKEAQLIMITHHPLLILSSEFNIIELGKGYLKKYQNWEEEIINNNCDNCCDCCDGGY